MSFAPHPRPLLLALACWLTPLAAPATEPPPITDAASLWSMPVEEKSREHALRLEGRVSYFDPMWRLLWLERDGLGTYVQLAVDTPAGLRAGQYVAIAGTIIPAKGLEASRVSVRVLREDEPVELLDTRGRINDLNALQRRMVMAEAFVDSQHYIDADHLLLNLIVENRPVTGWVKPDDAARLPQWAGKFVRFKALYSARFDPTATRCKVELWISREHDVEIVGTLADNALFQIPPTPIAALPHLLPGTEVRLRGRVESHEVGSNLILRDATGQVTVRSIQQERQRVGSEIETVGRMAVAGPEWLLDAALFRPVPGDVAVASTAAGEPSADTVLTKVDQLRQLSADQAAAGRAVELSGAVTWSLPESDFFFLQDVSGGIRVHFDRTKAEPPPLGKYLRVEGASRAGAFLPQVELARYIDLGAMDPPTARDVTVGEILAGQEDGQYVQLRGFLQHTISDGNWRWLQVTTPSGDFVGHLQSPVAFVANPGSLVRLRGVCETTADANGRITGITLRVPFLHDIAVEEDAPADVFDLPLKSVKDALRLSLSPTFMRVRVAATVVHAEPGRLVYVQDGGAGLLLLTREKLALQAGDRIEAVGVLGREGVRTIVREAAIRRVGSAPPPEPVVVADPVRLVPALDSQLVRVRGTLIDRFRLADRTQLTLQSGAAIFDARIPSEAALPALDLGAGLELTGVYRLVIDDSRESRGFQLQLRTPADVAVFRPARFFTVGRALLACGVLGGVVLLGLAWIWALRRRVRQQTQQLRAQLEKQALLEAEVQRATRLEALGTLAGGIAHDFNNLLTIILGNATLALTDDRAVRSVGENLSEIERASRRARDLTQQLLTFAKGGNPLRAAVALPEIVREASDLVLHGTSVRGDYDIAPDLWQAHVDKDQIAQAVHNLVLNAVQAMPNGGVVRLKLANQTVLPDSHPGLAEGRYVRLTLQDNGTGISPAVLPKIFDPYFTTKREGSGLGLATVYSVIRKHQGRIEARSPAGEGTIIDLWLPAAAPAPVPAVVAASELAPEAPPELVASAQQAPRKPRVLLMDDEDSIRRVLEIVLQRIGFDPVVVADGTAALREFKAARDAGRPIELLILDLTIPGGLGGRQVMEQVRELDPQVPAIVSSGYSNDPVLSRYREYGFQAMVQKPYDVRALGGLIKDVLAAKR